MKFGVIVFPGSNCDADCLYAVRDVLGQEGDYVWHHEMHLDRFDALILPGGFSYGDYLRSGAIAQFSPVMAAVRDFAKKGKAVIGICNGFQVLLEAGLLPGAMRRNHNLQFICRNAYVRVENAGTRFTKSCASGQVLRLPIAHMEGNYYAPPDILEAMKDRGQILLRYCSADGKTNPESNPNGSEDSIAGVMNECGNVFGLMPHPERACEDLLGSADGRAIFESMISFALNGEGRCSA